MGFPQWQRARFLIDEMKRMDLEGQDIADARSTLKLKVEAEFVHCHDCLLLAVYGFYKNGLIKDSDRPRAATPDFAGFSGRKSQDIQHAFDALEHLRQDASLSATDLKKLLGGEQSIYAFVVYYFSNGLLQL